MGIQYKVDMPDVDLALKKFDSYPAAADKELSDAMKKSVILTQGGARKDAPVGVSGRLRQSLEWKVTGGGSAIIGWVGSTMKSEVYPSVMEGGRRPGTMPPPSALERWVHIVLGVPENETRGVAFLVARAIAARGIRGRYFLLHAYERSREAINGYFRTALQNIVKAMVVR